MDGTYDRDLSHWLNVIFSFFVLILVASAVYAFDCNLVGDKNACEELKKVDEDLIADLVYANTSYPDHSFISDYNSEIIVDAAPNGTPVYSKGVIRDAWVSLLTVMPSVLYRENVFVSGPVNVRAAHNYDIVLPEDYYSEKKSSGGVCMITHSLDSSSQSLRFYANEKQVGSSDVFSFSLWRNSTLKAILEVTARLKKKEYSWYKYCCSMGEFGCEKYCYKCRLQRTTYRTDSIRAEDSMNLYLYEHELFADFQFISEYFGTSKGKLTRDTDTNVRLTFNSSYYSENNFRYSALFTKKPYYFLQLKAIKSRSTGQKNIIKDNYTFYVSDNSNCMIETSDFFTTQSRECDYDFIGEDVKPIERTSYETSWNFIYKIAVFLFINRLLYGIIKKYWNFKKFGI